MSIWKRNQSAKAEKVERARAEEQKKYNTFVSVWIVNKRSILEVIYYYGDDKRSNYGNGRNGLESEEIWSVRKEG